MKTHTIKRFEDEMNELKDKVLAMGGLVEKATKRSMNSLIKHDAKRAHKVIERDHTINAMEIEIDEMTRTMLALRQPAASDLRFVMTTIKVVTDLERMGDLAEDIAENMLDTEDHPLMQVTSLQRLSEVVLTQLRDALDAFARGDVDAALKCIDGDKRIDEMYKAMQREFLTYMLEDPRQITAALIASNIARDLERIGDHAVNVAEMVIYMVKGNDIRHIDHKTATAIVSGELDEEV
ncbi:phosphate signaling complex protein PhoU [Mariprofundus sp. NF]|uniref:phosphate signaling complex protein PhoU n=1 Tax=Mariprofundus sp. NF TaxID=2608716 RepID=UPI0015A0608B|nr:phosphate signaling complex protein PhoU [Mariprofundus sp. NF]NWF38039.1 phosphate signaling complex protein PhoU [Mariprofundus sp. NF]